MTRHPFLRAAATATILAIAVAIAGCSGGSGGSSGSTAPAPSAPAGGAVVVAQDLKFDRQTIAVPANQATPLLFENRDAAPHNVTLIAADGTKVFTGETFSGPGSRTYQLPPLTAGSYRFQCDVHPDMKGTLSAG
jgi:plastocyanin